MSSMSLRICETLGHQRVRSSPDGYNIILECPECCMAWLVSPHGDETRLYGHIVLRLTQQKIERQRMAFA